MRKAVLFSFLGILIFAAGMAFAQGPGLWGYGRGPDLMDGYGHGMMAHYGGSYCPNCGAFQGHQGGYGPGPGMMGPGWRGQGWLNQSEECKKFYHDTAALRKDLVNKRFDYLEALRNPATTAEQAAKMEKEIWDLQQKIFSKAPLACW
ncbi:MAG: hypothetical protein HY892_09405 [Deltaproteobacteria bacterium]|nr:hypothetical protein [Deltaproteobacteria bacterium]